MLRQLTGIISVFLAFPICCIAAGPIKGKVVSVSSGNLISFQDESGEIREISLYGIDAPDNEQKMGQHARKMLSAMIGDKEVEVKQNEGEAKGIPSAYIALNGLSINAALVKSGCAWVNPATCKSSNCSTWKEYQQHAKENKKGLWVDHDAEPPWQWRERRAKAEEIAKKMNAESDYVTYYGSLAESGHRSLWAKNTLAVSSSLSAGVDASSGGGGGTSSSGAAAQSNRSSLNSGTSAKSPGPRRG